MCTKMDKKRTYEIIGQLKKMDTFARVDDLVCETRDIFMGRVWVIVWVSICVFLSEPPSHNSLCLVNSVRWSPGIDESMKQYVQIQRQTSCLKRFSVISARANARLVGVAIGLIKFLIWICYTIGRCIVCTLSVMIDLFRWSSPISGFSMDIIEIA